MQSGALLKVEPSNSEEIKIYCANFTKNFTLFAATAKNDADCTPAAELPLEILNEEIGGKLAALAFQDFSVNSQAKIAKAKENIRITPNTSEPKMAFKAAWNNR